MNPVGSALGRRLWISHLGDLAAFCSTWGGSNGGGRRGEGLFRARKSGAKGPERPRVTTEGLEAPEAKGQKEVKRGMDSKSHEHGTYTMTYQGPQNFSSSGE